MIGEIPYEVEEEASYRYSKTLGEIMLERAKELELRHQNKDLYKPIPTHIGDLNDIIGGFPTEPFIWLLFAKEKIGKTTVAMDLADAWRKGGAKFLYVQLEELASQYADRMFASMTSLTKDDIRMLNFTEEHISELYMAAKRIKESGRDTLYIQDDLFQVEAVIQEGIRLGVDKFVFDNLSFFDLTGMPGHGEREKLNAFASLLVKYRNQKRLSFVVVGHEGSDDKAFGTSFFNKAADLLTQIEFVYEDTGDGEKSKKKPKAIEGQRCLHSLPSRLSREGRAYVAFDGAKNKITPIKKQEVNDDEFLQRLKEEGPAPQVLL